MRRSHGREEHLLPRAELQEPREGERAGARPGVQDARSAGLLHQGDDQRQRPVRPDSVGSVGHAAAGLRSRARRHHRRPRQEHPARRRARSRLRLHDHQRRLGARPAEDATCSGSRARASTASARWARSSSPPTSSAIRRRSGSRSGSTATTKQDSTTANMIFPVDCHHRVAVAGPDARAGRHHRHGHARRRRPRRARRRST